MASGYNRQIDRLLGLLLGIVALCILSGTLAPFMKDQPVIGIFARMLDSLSFHLFALAAALSLVIALLGARWEAALLLGLTLGGGGLVLQQDLSHRVALAPAATPTVRVIWFNALRTNRTPPDRLVEAIRNSGADLVVLAEAEALQDHVHQLAAEYPHMDGCEGRACEVLVLSRHPFVTPPKRTHQARPAHLVQVRLQPPGHAAFSVVATHLSKPWSYGFIELDRWFLLDAVRNSPGPLLLMGDFNAAAWSYQMQDVFDRTGLAPSGPPVATWPASLGPLGVPIDQMLVGGGLRLSTLTPWGEDLGSNHRGLLAEIHLPGAGD